ncbi:ABC transporter transmembrane domain-containing protein [Sphingorhabdus sp.]|jgi:ATP-binding cassette, subfamily B, bacterial|uniref:ABC transporter transmembrane domain-containing protein n=1 Tax=Sphingorhabdus sp. TaxID=1902408 RepID=UPI0040471F35
MTIETTDAPTLNASETAETIAAKPKPNFGSLRMIGHFTIRYPRQITYALLALIAAAGSTLAIPYGLRLIIDEGFAKNGGDPAPYFYLLLGIVVIIGISTAFRFYFVSWLGERVVGDIRVAVQQNLLRLAPRFFEENRPGEIASRMTADTAIIEQIVGTTVSVALRNIFIGVGGVTLLFGLAPSLTIWLLAGIPAVVLPIVFLGRRLEKASRNSQDNVASIGTIISEALAAIKIVQAFGQENREGVRFSDAVERTFVAAKKRIRLRAFLTALVMALIFGGITLLVWEGTDQVKEGVISSGTLFAVVLYGALVAGSFGALTEVYGDLVRASGAASRLAELLNEAPEIASPASPVIMPPARGQLEFQHVRFRYPTRPDVAALEDFSLKVSPGETVAVVGPSGAGKSTLFQLAERFYDPEIGTVRIDGVVLTSADPAEFRQRISLVPQDTVLFAASACDNLRYGQWDASDDAIWAAAEKANAAGFLRELPEGLETYLGEGGARLSGGQRQRLAIARALLRDSPILLLDEATSALDAESEKLVQDALERLMVGRTTIVIAHRLATVRSADRIIVMDQGRIVEEGDHATLSAAGGLYARLASLQFDA